MMADPGQAPDPDEAPLESRRTAPTRPDGSEPAPAEGGEVPTSDLPALGELGPESARPSPLDDIVEAEREQMPRD